MNLVKGVALVLIGILFFSIESFSNNNDTILDRKSTPSRRAAAIAAEKFTFARPLNVEFTQSTPYNFSPKKGFQSSSDGRVKNLSQAKVTANVNFYKKNEWLVGTTLGYNLVSVDAEIKPNVKLLDQTMHNFYAGLNVAYLSTLFNKRSVYTASVIVDGTHKHLERVRGLITGTLIVKATERTRMSVGLALSLDPLSVIPVIPTFSYNRKLNNDLALDILMPRNVYIRKMMFGNGRVSLGSELDQTSFYLYNIDGTDQKYVYRQLDINSGVVYEHLLGDVFLLTAKTGIRYTPSGRLFKKNDSYKDPTLEMKPDPSFYFNIGISFNPSSILRKK